MESTGASTIVMSASDVDGFKLLEEDRVSLETKFRSVCNVSVNRESDNILNRVVA